MTTLVLATRNQGKLKEIQHMLGPAVKVQALDAFPDAPDIIEDGETFEANAIKKARKIANFIGLPALADDSGLIVDALDGAPGIYSARYAGENATDADNNAKLLKNLTHVPKDQRTARFRCAMALIAPDGAVQTVQAVWEGYILTAPCGKHGFGYDPLFLIPEYHCTFGELGPAVKAALSHRARAMRIFLPRLLEEFAAL